MSEPRAYDVIVIGSGGPGLVAALRARERGSRDADLEKTDRIGGTTAVSGGKLWVPGNHHMRKLDILD
ncbi:MAG: FAD-binding protein, partial [Candidatus Rokubacteria bacterium]|nr:FAD-binding protein [Candidatus Rokubacteria bacterium]